jgi:hypothetical protein
LRKILITAAGTLALAAPVFAQPVPAPVPAEAPPAYPDPADDEFTRALPHPYDVEEAGDTLGRAVGAIMNVPVGGVVQAVDPTTRVRRDETLGDLARRDDPHAEERIQDEMQVLTMKMADMMRQVAVVAPVLRRSLADLERDLGRAIDPDRGY